MSSRATAPPAPEAAAPEFSLVAQDPLYRVQCMAWLVPSRGYGIVRRIGFVVIVGWLPLVLWSLAHRRAFGAEDVEPLLRHFGVHARFLVALPLMLVAEPLAEAIVRRLVAYFVTSGLVPPSERTAFDEVVEGSRRLIRSRVALAAIAGLALAGSVLGSQGHVHEVEWAVTADGQGQHLSSAAWWFLWVSQPLYQVFLLSWLWRLLVTAVLLGRISRLDLQLVPTHPDRCGGLGFLQTLPTAFAPVIAAASVVLSARWAHDVVYHGVHVSALRLPMALFTVLLLVLFLCPLLVFAPKLAALKRRSLLAYGSLVGRHGRLVERRWVRGEMIEDEGLLDAPELGPVADTLTLYESVARLRPTPIGKQSVITVAGAAVLPMLPVIAIEVPIKDQLLGLLKILL